MTVAQAGRAGPVGGTAASAGLAGGPVSLPQAQVLRNQAVGSTWTVAASGPALVTPIRISRSSGPALAYVTSTIQYFPASNAPVSSSSNSGCDRSRAAFSAISSA